MKAWRVDQHGGPEALVWVDVPEPTPGPLEARVRVQAVGLNHLDVWVRKGVPGHRFPLPLIPGTDIAGVIESFGAGAENALARSGLKVGAPVLVSPGTSCGRCEACLGGFDPLCPEYGIFGETKNGGLTELVCVPTQNLIPRPASLTAAQAAALPIPYLTAWTMLFRKAQLKPGEIVLVQAGGSAVSVAAIQLCKMVGAQVATTVGSPEKAARARALGADLVIEYRHTPFREALKPWLAERGKKGCDIVLDHVGAETWAESMKALAWGGRIVTCGATTGGEVAIDLKAVFFKNLSILGATMGSKADLLRIVELAARGILRPVIDAEIPLARTPDAFARLEKREVFGKLVITS